MERMKKHIEVYHAQSGDVVKSIDVSDKSDRQIDKIERGVMINLNHNEYYIITTES